MRIKIIYLITALGRGGAENFLYRLVTALPKDEFDVLVVSLKGRGGLAKDLNRAGIAIYEMNFSFNPVLFLFEFKKLIKIIKNYKPNLIHSWMYHADFMTIFINLFFPKMRYIWCVRNLSLDKKDVGMVTRVIAKACALFSSKVPEKIICNGQSICSYHEQFGYSKNRLKVIPNGFNTEIFYPSKKAAEQFRKSFAIGEDRVVLALVGRGHPIKGHCELIQALKGLLKETPNLLLFFIGVEDGAYKQSVKNMIEEEQLEQHIKIIPQQNDMNAVYNGIDLLISNSASEGLSNVIGEAMSAGTTVLVTDVGESEVLVGAYGMVVPFGNMTAMYDSVKWFLAKMVLLERLIKPANRNRIKTKFSLTQSIQSYSDIYAEVLSR